MNSQALLVTGASGFIGRYVVSELCTLGRRTYVLTRESNESLERTPNIVRISVDISKPFEIPNDVGSVYHCAGVISDENRMYAVNVDGTRHVVEAALSRNCRLIHLSSAGVVGPVHQGVVDETSPCHPASLYEQTKWEAEQVVSAAVADGLRAVSLRPTIVFGSGRDPSRDSFLHLLRAIKEGSYRHISCGSGIYNVVHAREVARAMVALDSSSIHNGDVFMINSPISFYDFVRVVTSALACKTPGSIPYSVAYLIAAAFTGIATLTNRRMPLTLSRLAALTTKATYSQHKLSSLTTYKPLMGVDGYIEQTCNEFVRDGLL